MPRKGYTKKNSPARIAREAMAAAGLTKAEAKERLRELLTAQLDAVVTSLLLRARGRRHAWLKDPKTQQFIRVIDPDGVDHIINHGTEGKDYWTITMDPDALAIKTCLEYIADKPLQPQSVAVSGSLDLIGQRLIEAIDRRRARLGEAGA